MEIKDLSINWEGNIKARSHGCGCCSCDFEPEISDLEETLKKLEEKEKTIKMAIAMINKYSKELLRSWSAIVMEWKQMIEKSKMAELYTPELEQGTAYKTAYDERENTEKQLKNLQPTIATIPNDVFEFIDILLAEG